MTKEMQTKVEGYARVHKSLLNQTKLDAIDWLEKQQEPTSDHWQDLRERAAIAAMQGLLAQSGDAYTELVIAKEAIIYADARVKKLKGE